MQTKLKGVVQKLCNADFLKKTFIILIFFSIGFFLSFSDFPWCHNNKIEFKNSKSKIQYSGVIIYKYPPVLSNFRSIFQDEQTLTFHNNE